MKNEEEMKAIIRKIINNEIVFNNQKIKRNALKKYSAEKYKKSYWIFFQN